MSCQLHNLNRGVIQSRDYRKKGIFPRCRANTKTRKKCSLMLKATQEQEWRADQVVQVMLHGKRALDAAMLIAETLMYMERRPDEAGVLDFATHVLPRKEESWRLTTKGLQFRPSRGSNPLMRGVMVLRRIRQPTRIRAPHYLSRGDNLFFVYRPVGSKKTVRRSLGRYPRVTLSRRRTGGLLVCFGTTCASWQQRRSRA